MHRKLVIAGLLGFIAAALASLLVGSSVAESAQPPLPVIEQNTDTNGSIKVHEQGTAAVAARQDGSWNVGISGAPNVRLDAAGNTVKLDSGANGVRVTNAADAPVPTRDAENPARQQFNRMVQIHIATGSAAGSAPIDLPQDKYLVIAHVSGQAELPPDQHPLFQLQFATFKHFLPFRLEVSPGAQIRDVWVLTEPLDVIYGPASHITAELSRIDTAGPVDADITVSGYLVDYP
jgi:hypothetical protein